MITIDLRFGDTLEQMKSIPDGSIDFICCDLPYGLTKNKWDSVIPLDELWKAYKRIIKNNGAIVLFGQDKFSARLMLSNESMHRYNLIWKKGERTSGFLNAKKMPLRNHEDILIFYKKLPTYNPQMVIGKKSNSRGKGVDTNNNYGSFISSKGEAPNGEYKYPKSILNFERPHPPIHPTQKPVSLVENLILTYTNENDTVLDNTFGSCTTGIACINTGRNFIGIEKNEEYFNMSIKRVEEKTKEKEFLFTINK
jgi:site-specific DNA-methyltransferase (adenine-specific)